MKGIDEVLGERAVLPVFRVEAAEHAASVARALWDGGIRVAEITLRTPVALDGLAAARRAVPGLRLGVGTVNTADDVRRAVDAGASFLVTPGTTPSLLRALSECGVPCLPGVATASEAMTAAEHGFRALKFFPAEPAGGPEVLRAWSGPLPQLVFCPTGGIGADRVSAWLALPNVRWVGGSWIATDAAIRAGDWATIAANARRAAALVVG